MSMIIISLMAAFGGLQVAASPMPGTIDSQLENFSPQAWITERHSTGQVVRFRFYRRHVGDEGAPSPWGWIGVRSAEAGNGQIEHAFLTSSSCHAVGEAMAEFSRLTIPEWTFDQPPPAPVVEGRDLEPTPKDGVIYVAGLETLHLRGSASKIEVEFWKGAEVETLGNVVRQLQLCWHNEPVDLRPR